MSFILRTLRESPAAARIAPYFIFVLLTFAQDALGSEGRYWIYLAKTLVGVWFIWAVRPFVKEMRWSVSWEAVVVGVAVCAVWVVLGDWTRGSKPEDAAKLWNPFQQFGAEAALAWFFIVVRTLGSSLVVPPLEEAFFRSYFYRFLSNPNFETVPLTYFSWVPFVVTSIVFAAMHHPADYPAAILCGMAYQWLVLRKGRLGDAITAHAITNFLLSLWSVWQQDWRFW